MDIQLVDKHAKGLKRLKEHVPPSRNQREKNVELSKEPVDHSINLTSQL